MKTIRITRQGFPNQSMHSWMRYFIFVLSKKYNVVVDSVNPDLVIFSNLDYNENQMDTFLGSLPISHSRDDRNKKFLYVSGEVADFYSPILANENVWSIGYNKFEHERYLRQPSGVLDVWTLFDESRLTDSPLNWLTEKRNFDKISKRNLGFCSITQASDNIFRGVVFDKLSEYKQVTSSGPWRQNLHGSETLNKYQWQNSIYNGRMDGLTYREKINFFQKYKFNISIHFTDTNYILQEKIYHSYFSGSIPIFYGNKNILEEGFNPESFINLHEYENLDEFLELIKKIDTDSLLYKKYIESPIFVDNKLPEYYNFEFTLNFLEKLIES
jgi:hypothetical protein